MPVRKMFCAIAVLTLTCSVSYGQAKKVPVLREYTTEQRWTRAQAHADVFFTAAVGYAKSLNRTADDFYQYTVKTFAPSWGKPDSVSPMRVFRGMRGNFLAWSDWKIELVDSLENKVMGRFNRPYVSRLFKDNVPFYGMTLDEYEAGFRTFNRGICEYLHLKYEDKVEGDWVTFTISKK